MKRALAALWLAVGVCGFIGGLFIYPLSSLAIEDDQAGHYRIKSSPIWERPEYAPSQHLITVGGNQSNPTAHTILLPGPTTPKEASVYRRAARTIAITSRAPIEPRASEMSAMGRSLCRKAGVPLDSTLCLRVNIPEEATSPPVVTFEKRAQKLEHHAEKSDASLREATTETLGKIQDYAGQTEGVLFEAKTRYERQLVNIQTQSKRYRLIREAEADAAEVRLRAELSTAAARNASLNSRLTSKALAQPGANNFVTVQGIRNFRLPASLQSSLTWPQLHAFVNLPAWLKVFKPFIPIAPYSPSDDPPQADGTPLP